MLELRPTCELCNMTLPPDSVDARICSFECMFCATSVEKILGNVSLNCGGGFVPRPIRPTKNWKDDNFLVVYPASINVKPRPIDLKAHAQFAASLNALPPGKR